VKIYDLLCGGRNLGKSTWLSQAEVLRAVPGLAGTSLKGAVRYYDGFTNDARLTIDTLRSAEKHGATLLNYCRFQGASRSEHWQCELEDRPSEKTFLAHARAVVNATGPWADGLPHSRVKLRLTKGIHLVVDNSRLPVTETVVMTEGKRILFAIPWGERTILGTTDTDYNEPLDDVRADAQDIGYVLQIANQFFPAANLADADVISVWAGLRPLIADPSGKPSDISRAHEIRNPEPGWWDVAGGKLTTYRLMGEQTVDRIIKELRKAIDQPPRPLATRPSHEPTPLPPSAPSPPLGGRGKGREFPKGIRALNPRASPTPAFGARSPLGGERERERGPSIPSAGSWAGGRIGHTMLTRELARCRTAAEPLLPVAETSGVSGILPPEFSRKAVEHYVANEWAVHLDDVMVRRTSWHYYFQDAAAKAQQVAAWMAELHGWTETQQAAEIARYGQIGSRLTSQKPQCSAEATQRHGQLSLPLV
jgi:glycerol-3-phosphate dehydrogenase